MGSTPLYPSILKYKAMYIIWKASIMDYRVLNTKTGEVKVLQNFTLKNCALKVDINRYNEAKKQGFTNSGNDNDYFAWIEASKVIEQPNKAIKSTLFYNPFKSAYFRQRSTGERMDFLNRIRINGNTLSYE